MAKITLSKIKKNITRRRIIFASIVILVILVARFLSTRGVVAVQTQSVSRGDITESVSTSGKIDAEKKADLTFQTVGKLAWVGVASGDTVRAGQAVASLETTPLDAAYEQALNNWKTREAEAEAVLDSLKGHDTDETFIQKAQRTDAQVARDNAYDAVRATEYNLRQAVLIAPFGGIITNAIPLNAGVNVSPATSVYSIVDPTSLFFSGEITEADIGNIQKDLDVKISLDAFPNKTFESKIGKIDFASFINSTGATAYHIKIALPKDPGVSLRLGMNGDAEIILKIDKNVLYVPVTAIVEDGNKTYVWTVVNGKAKKVEVKTGISSVDQTEIAEGVSEKDKIISNPSLKLKDGLVVKTS